MLKKILGLFSGAGGKETGKESLPRITMDKLGQPVNEDIIIAISVILVHVASSDDQVAKEEAEAICSMLEYNLELPESEIPNVVQKAILGRREKGKIDDFVAVLNSSYTVEQRLRILSMAWKLVLSDNKVEKPEERTLVKLATTLYLTLEHQDQARHFAEEGAV
jgi:uncharacterized tellurite resistance protein B-like protein